MVGKRPKVRGVAMNPVDHPHGGGEEDQRLIIDAQLGRMRQ